MGVSLPALGAAEGGAVRKRYLEAITEWSRRWGKAISAWWIDQARLPHPAAYDALADAIKDVLAKAIRAGGTTLRDFYGGDGEAGYFQQQLQTYGREDQPCRRCGTLITAIVQGQRSTYYCKRCQT